MEDVEDLDTTAPKSIFADAAVVVREPTLIEGNDI